MLAIDVETRLGSLQLRAELVVSPGVLALCGPSGSGKTTLLRTVVGLIRGSRGHITLGERVWLDSDARIDLAPDARGVGLVPQGGALFPHLTARQNIAFGMRGPRAERTAQADALLERFGLTHRADARPGQLSGGECQRVALARALASGPSAMLLDEPLAALDASIRAEAIAEIRMRVSVLAVPTVVVTHSFAEAAALAERVAVMDRGRVVQVGTPAELADRPGSRFVADLTDVNALLGLAVERVDSTDVRLGNGTRIRSRERLTGAVLVTVYPSDVAVSPVDLPPDSTRNSVVGIVDSVVPVAGASRVRIGGANPIVAVLPRGETAPRVGEAVRAHWTLESTRLVAQ